MELQLQEFGYMKGYEISWEELDKIIDKVFLEKNMENGWYQVVRGNIWEKGDKKRNYLTLKKYRNGKLRSEEKLGFYDYVEERYIITDRRTVITDVIEKYNEIMEG